MKRWTKFIPLLLLVLSSLVSRAQSSNLERDLLFLTDSLQAGRAFGTAGAQSVTFNILRRFKSAGLRTTVQSFEFGGKVGHNVIGVTKGWFRQYIVVGAYYDGHGILDGELFPGADSNASGVAALLNLSTSLPGFANGPIGIIFVAYDGHNAGLSGSKAFFEHYSKQYPNITLEVNLDIIGSTLEPLREGHPNYLLAIGGGKYAYSFYKANKDLDLELTFDYYGSEAFTELFQSRISDQKPFVEAGIPCVMFTSGITSNTNKPSDTVENLDLEVYSRRVAFITKWLISLL